MKNCPMHQTDANPEACLYIDCDFYKERKCDFPNARKGGMPITDCDGAYHYAEEGLTTILMLRLFRMTATPAKVTFIMARALIDKAEAEFIKHKSREN